jgi:hypothetical protein
MPNFIFQKKKEKKEKKGGEFIAKLNGCPKVHNLMGGFVFKYRTFLN